MKTVLVALVLAVMLNGCATAPVQPPGASEVDLAIQRQKEASDKVFDLVMEQTKTRSRCFKLIKIGMQDDDPVIIELGPPDKKNVTRSANLIWEQWVYDNPSITLENKGIWKILYFRNHVLTTVQESQ